jgi:putative hemolysin
MEITEKRSRQQLISPEEVSSIVKIKGIAGMGASGIIMSVLGFNKINELYSKHIDKLGLDFVDAILADLEIQYEINPAELKRIPTKGSFIIVSNHPYGGIEALILIKEVSKIRPDFKVIANFLFHRIEPLREYIFPVNPFESMKDKGQSFIGLKDGLCHIENGNCLLMFPAGEVSTTYPNSQGVSDRKWMKQAVKFIRKANTSVLPVFFSGSNSKLFHSIGLIHPLLRTAKLPSEMLNKKNKTVKVSIGNPILDSEQLEYENIDLFGRFLRAKTYMLDSNVNVKSFFANTKSTNEKQEPVIEAVSKTILKYEVDSLPVECMLFKQSSFNVFCAQANQIPNVLTEIGRLREITFREVGEGTNLKIDIDNYDLYYNHLFIWDDISNSIVGAYRIGMGAQIMQEYGSKGFYLRSLFKINNGFKPILHESLELGRSFIIKEFQRTPLPLFLLWKGILHFLVRNPDYRYLIGPVSISNNFSNISKSMIVDYIMRNHYNHELAGMVKPKKKFRPVFPNDTYMLTENAKSLKDIDFIIKDIEGNSRIPILLKKYIELNGKIVSFNIDPKFNDALDGMLVLDLLKIPENTIRMLSKEMDASLLKSRFKNVDSIMFDYSDYDSVPQF